MIITHLIHSPNLRVQVELRSPSRTCEIFNGTRSADRLTTKQWREGERLLTPVHSQLPSQTLLSRFFPFVVCVSDQCVRARSQLTRSFNNCRICIFAPKKTLCLLLISSNLGHCPSTHTRFDHSMTDHLGVLKQKTTNNLNNHVINHPQN